MQATALEPQIGQQVLLANWRGDLVFGKVLGKECCKFRVVSKSPDEGPTPSPVIFGLYSIDELAF